MTSKVLARDLRDSGAVNRRIRGGVGVGEMLHSTWLRWLLQAEHKAPQSRKWGGASCLWTPQTWGSSWRCKERGATCHKTSPLGV